MILVAKVVKIYGVLSGNYNITGSSSVSSPNVKNIFFFVSLHPIYKKFQ